MKTLLSVLFASIVFTACDDKKANSPQNGTKYDQGLNGQGSSSNGVESQKPPGGQPKIGESPNVQTTPTQPPNPNPDGGRPVQPPNVGK